MVDFTMLFRVVRKQESLRRRASALWRVGSEERRFVAILFTDVVTSSQISTVDADGLARADGAILQHRPRGDRPARRYREKFIGDAVWWSSPGDSRDDPLRAGRP